MKIPNKILLFIPMFSVVTGQLPAFLQRFMPKISGYSILSPFASSSLNSPSYASPPPSSGFGSSPFGSSNNGFESSNSGFGSSSFGSLMALGSSSPYGSLGLGPQFFQSSNFGNMPMASTNFGTSSYPQRNQGSSSNGPLFSPSSFGQSPYGSSSFGQSSYGSPSFGQSPYGSPSFGQSPYGSPSFGQSPYGSPVFASGTFNQPSFGPKLSPLASDSLIAFDNDGGFESPDLLDDFPGFSNTDFAKDLNFAGSQPTRYKEPLSLNSDFSFKKRSGNV